jgi:hypothetical protein
MIFVLIKQQLPLFRTLSLFESGFAPPIYSNANEAWWVEKFFKVNSFRTRPAFSGQAFHKIVTRFYSSLNRFGK